MLQILSSKVIPTEDKNNTNDPVAEKYAETEDAANENALGLL